MRPEHIEGAVLALFAVLAFAVCRQVFPRRRGRMTFGLAVVRSVLVRLTALTYAWERGRDEYLRVYRACLAHELEAFGLEPKASHSEVSFLPLEADEIPT